jgi:hypothetical protein
MTVERKDFFVTEEDGYEWIPFNAESAEAAVMDYIHDTYGGLDYMLDDSATFYVREAKAKQWKYTVEAQPTISEVK